MQSTCYHSTLYCMKLFSKYIYIYIIRLATYSYIYLCLRLILKPQIIPLKKIGISLFPFKVFFFLAKLTQRQQTRKKNNMRNIEKNSISLKYYWQFHLKRHVLNYLYSSYGARMTTVSLHLFAFQHSWLHTIADFSLEHVLVICRNPEYSCLSEEHICKLFTENSLDLCIVLMEHI